MEMNGNFFDRLETNRPVYYEYDGVKYQILIENIGNYKSILGDNPSTGTPIIVVNRELTREEKIKQIYELIFNIDTNDFIEEEIKEFNQFRNNRDKKCVEEVKRMYM